MDERARPVEVYLMLFACLALLYAVTELAVFLAAFPVAPASAPL